MLATTVQLTRAVFLFEPATLAVALEARREETIPHRIVPKHHALMRALRADEDCPR